MDTGGLACRPAERTTPYRNVPSGPKPLPPAIEDAIDRFEQFERAYALAAITTLELELASRLRLGAVQCVWMDWSLGRWYPRGNISPRLQNLTSLVATNGRRFVLDNAILEPIGRAPRAVLIFRGPPHQLFQQHTLRIIGRIAERLAPTMYRLMPR
jgi:hypothetical protein